ncbi:MAG: HDOD domain-containing protein [Fimbriimonadaceae bacterium]|nr:HDOD domain-containing protein [Fimbriimonadaceae bacterium]QYK56183.1 MAG: HDOD domain-containing protein [Fimbriimonadaceae bacterium]
MSSTITLEDIVKRTPDLPSLPAAAMKVMREADSSTSNARSIANILAQDQALTARVLRLANSAYYGLQRKVSNLQESVVVLGMRCVRNLCMVAATYPWMSRKLDGYNLGPKELWTHSFGTALGAQLAAQECKKCDPDLAFTAGLLHDIGKVALSVWLENKSNLIAEYSAKANVPFDEAERKILGYDHTEVGEHLGRQWNLPDEIVSAIRYHHEPDECPEPSALVDCVHVGNFLTLTMGFGLGGDGLLYRVCEGSFERLGLKPDDLDALADTFVVGYEEYEKLFAELARI